MCILLIYLNLIINKILRFLSTIVEILSHFLFLVVENVIIFIEDISLHNILQNKKRKGEIFMKLGQTKMKERECTINDYQKFSIDMIQKIDNVNSLKMIYEFVMKYFLIKGRQEGRV